MFSAYIEVGGPPETLSQKPLESTIYLLEETVFPTFGFLARWVFDADSVGIFFAFIVTKISDENYRLVHKQEIEVTRPGKQVS